MATITVHAPSGTRHLSAHGSATCPSPLPQLLHTPAGLALIELQGNINHPQDDGGSEDVPIGRLAFPDFDPDDPLLAEKGGEGGWMKRVWLYVGEHQRLTGEVKKLAKPLGVLRRRERTPRDDAHSGQGTEPMDGIERLAGGHEDEEELEIVEVIKWKILFNSRPEPVGVANDQ